MNAKKIRELPVIGLDTKLDGHKVDDVNCALQVQTNQLLKEIAAQLAELNEHIHIEGQGLASSVDKIGLEKYPLYVKEV